MKKEELIDKYIQEDKLEQALSLLENDKSSVSSEHKLVLIQECKRKLSEQYTYLIKECILTGKGKDALGIIGKYKEYFGNTAQIEAWETKAVSLLKPNEQKLFIVKSKYDKITSLVPNFVFILIQIIWGITYLLTIEYYETWWLECLKFILIIVSGILLHLSFVSINNSINLFHLGRKDVRNVLYIFLGTYMINQLYVSFICFYPSFISDFIFEYFIPFIVTNLILQLLFIIHLFRFGNSEYKTFALLAVAAIIFPFILYFREEGGILDNLGWYPFFNIGGWCIYMLLFSLRVKAVVRNNKIDEYGNN